MTTKQLTFTCRLGIYEKEWEDVLEGETKSYRSTVSALGGLIQTDLISIAEKLSCALLPSCAV